MAWLSGGVMTKVVTSVGFLAAFLSRLRFRGPHDRNRVGGQVRNGAIASV